MRRIITALFHSQQVAQRAAERVIALGIPQQAVTLHSAINEDDVPATGGSPGSEHGLLRLLDAMFLPRADFAAHVEALRRGGIVVTAEVDESQGDSVRQALKDAGAEDLDAHEQDWLRQGWHPIAGPAVQHGSPKKEAKREPVAGPARSYRVDPPSGRPG